MFSYWLDEEQIPSGGSIPIHINDGLRRSELLVAVVTKSFLSKRWAQTELGALMHQEVGANKIRVLAVVAGGANVETRFKAELPLVAQKSYISWEDASSVADAIQKAVSGGGGASIPNSP